MRRNEIEPVITRADKKHATSKGAHRSLECRAKVVMQDDKIIT